MNNQLQIFKNDEFGQVRGILINDEPYFIGKEVATVLGYIDTKSAISDHVDKEDRTIIQKGQIATLEIPNRGLTIINESGLYSLILSSKLPNAKKFKRWVTSEVLPSIRKYGMYATDELLDDPDLLMKVATKLKEEKAKNKALEEEKKMNAPKVIFADAVSTSKSSILVGELAKLLKQNGVDTGEKRLFAYLRKNKYLISRKGTDYNMPTQKSAELGLFQVKETPVVHSDGHISVNKTPKVTGKGQQYFINKFLNKEAI